jgi:hypothetical protein
VVSTTKGVESLDFKNGTMLVIKDDLNEFAKHIKNPYIAEELRGSAKSIIDNC